MRGREEGDTQTERKIHTYKLIAVVVRWPS